MAGGRGFTLGLMVGVEIPVSPSSAQQELTGTYLTFAHHYHHYHTLLPSLLPRLPQHTTIVQQSFRYSSKHHQSLFFHFKRYSPGPTFLPATRSFYTHFPHLLTNTLLLIFLVACPVLILETQHSGHYPTTPKRTILYQTSFHSSIEILQSSTPS